MGRCIERVFKKISLKPNATSPNIISSYTDNRWVPRILTKWGSLYYKGLALQKRILVFWIPLVYTSGH